MQATRNWTLGAKLALVTTPFLLLALATIAVTLWVSWQLEGGAAAINETGRLRMQAYRMALTVGDRAPVPLPAGAQAQAKGQWPASAPAQALEFGRTLEMLRKGDPDRPLFIPWDDDVRARFARVQAAWAQTQPHWASSPTANPAVLQSQAAALVADIDALVHGIEVHMSRWTALLHLAQVFTMALALAGAAVLVFAGYLFVLEPVGQLRRTMLDIQHGNLGARVRNASSDEFGALAEGFNDMASQVQTVYQNLEARVAEKTAELQEKRERLEALYQVTSLVANARSLQELSDGFVRRLRAIAHADAVALRWSDETNQRYLMLASDGLPSSMLEAEHCVPAGDCECGTPVGASALRVIPIQAMQRAQMQHCVRAGFETIVSLPIHWQERLMGEVNLFYHARCEVAGSDRSLLEALTAHLASAMENVRLHALEKEAAVSQERSFLARELHDSIAQSLAFLKIQVGLMHDALAGDGHAQAQAVLQEIDIGVRESYADVRELLVHFRTRANTQDIEPALRTTLRKFELQSGLPTHLHMEGHGIALDPDLQLQVLHIVQEALSNVRKHADASQVWLDVQQQPCWRFEVRDNGTGFAAERATHDETHVGLRIMRERAERIDARLEVLSTPGRGTSVIVSLQPHPTTARPAAHAPEPQTVS